MDGNRFDDLGRALGVLGSRRGALRVLIGAAFGALAGNPAGDALAKPKGKGRGKGKRKNKKKGCKRTPCSGGMEFDTGSCRCKCPSDMRECKDGCVGKDACCPGDPPCPEDPKGCCHAPGLDICTIDGCCRELDGMKACNGFCIDTNSNPNHCGGCNSPCEPGEACVNGQCAPPNECPSGIICPGRTAPHCGREGFQCCGDIECNAFHECCNPNEDRCCLKGRCVEGRCCPEGREICAGKCCPFGEKCCGGECCSSFFCVNGTCCDNIPCGRSPGSRVCPGDTEFCCGPTLDSDDGWACPRGDVNAGTAYCAPGGRCCPAGTEYRDDCGACCASLFHTCPFAECVPPTTGRF